MQLTFKNLNQQVQQNLAPFYLISGDEILLIREAREIIRTAAKSRDYLQHERIIAERGFNSNQFLHIVLSQNLFNEKRLVEIDHSSLKLAKDMSKTLVSYAESPNPDAIVVLITDKLTREQQNTQWYKKISAAAATLVIWPINNQELPGWITARLNALNIRADQESIKLLANLTEGNLLATQQAIEKIKLLYPNEAITAAKISTLLIDNAKFNVFDLVNHALQGNARHCIRILNNLQQEEVEPILVLWALTREIRHLLTLIEKIENGTPVEQALKQEWQMRKPLVKSALTRHTPKSLSQSLYSAAKIDQIIKGIGAGNVWQALESLTLALAGIELKEIT